MQIAPVLIGLAALSLCGAAKAQTQTPNAPAPVAAAPTIRLATPQTASAPGAAQASALEAAVLPRTAVEHRFTDKGVVASAGFLCGLQSNLDADGAAAAAGFDPQGRFIGAKLSFAFR